MVVMLIYLIIYNISHLSLQVVTQRKQTNDRMLGFMYQAPSRPNRQFSSAGLIWRLSSCFHPLALIQLGN